MISRQVTGLVVEQAQYELVVLLQCHSEPPQEKAHLVAALELGISTWS